MEEEPRRGPVCQSCGMPMDQPDLFGTNKDGTKNGDYCANCYQDGMFTSPNISMEQMIELVAAILVKEMDFDPEKAREIAEGTIPKLKRWAA